MDFTKDFLIEFIGIIIFLIAMSNIIAEAGIIANKSFISEDPLDKLLSFGLEVVYIGSK